MAIIDYLHASHNMPTADEMRTRWCFGLPLRSRQTTTWTVAGQVLADADIQSMLRAAIGRVERSLGVLLKPTIIKCNFTAYKNGLVLGTDMDKVEPAYDYSYNQASQWGFLQTRHWPFLSIEGYKLMLPNGQQVLDFADSKLGGLPPNPTSWIKTYANQGQILLVPYAGISNVFYSGGGSGAMGLLGYMWMRDMPQCLWLDYTAGFALNKVPEELRNLVAKIAAVDMLGICGESELAGVASYSNGIDGLSQSVSTTASAENTTYGAHVMQYNKEINAFFDAKDGGARTYYKGFTMTVL